MTKSNNTSFISIVTVFFFWGFLAASNGIFIPFCKTHFQLSQFQSQLVDSAFFFAYFVGSLMLYLLSLQFNKDIVNQLGYKTTIILGLAISIVGAFVMMPAISSGSFAFILVAFFIIALGFSLQQTSANPLILNLGDPATGSHRLNFAGSINSFGTTIGPILVSVLLFGKAIADDTDKTSASISSINILYVILAIAFAIAAVILYFTKLSKLNIEEETNTMLVLKAPLQVIIGFLIIVVLIFTLSVIKSEPSNQLFLGCITAFFGLLLIWALTLTKQISTQQRFEQKSYPQVIWGMAAIFVYVGVEVSIQSNLGSLLKLPEFGNLADADISPFISIYWGSLMIGRWTGSLGAFKLNKTSTLILTLVVPFLAFALVLFMNYLNGFNPQSFYVYALCIVFLIGAFFLGKQKPALTLMLFGGLGTISMIIGLLTVGKISVFAFLSGGLFCSIMWPCIFSLAIAGLGKYTSQASAFLIMMIVGGAIIPPLQGLLADATSIHSSYIIPVLCFAFLTFYAFKVKSILQKEGIDYDNQEASAH